MRRTVSLSRELLPRWRDALKGGSETKLTSVLVSHLKRDFPLVACDATIVAAAYLAILVIRFDGSVPASYWRPFWAFLTVICGAHLLMNYFFGLYGQMWRYAGLQEARRVVLSGGCALGLILTAELLLAAGRRPVPISVAVLGALISFAGFGAVRFQSRLFAFRRRTAVDPAARVLVIGAGDAGASILRDLSRDAGVRLEPVGLVDDDKRKVGRSLHGVRVLGSTKDLVRLCEQLSVDQVLLAVPSATGQQVRDIAELCEEAGVTLRVLPSVEETVSGRITVRDIRDLKIEDLLGRQQVGVDLALVASLLAGRRVLVTGAGGSIGSEIARQVASFSPAQLFVLDRDETLLHELIMDLSDTVEVRSVLADVRDRDRVHATFNKLRPEIVFHAAAHKHVPVLEAHPEEALATNIIGTANLADAAVAADVEHFVLISTDKAIRPSSVMGATKWFAEQVIRSLDGGKCKFCSVRFGNVLGSRGSVIPTFLRQISQGGPVTVTDASMTRYFMSVHEAVQLVLQASALAGGGEVFTLNMGEPVKIIDLARELIRLSGRVPYRDVGIDVVGVRPGEKLHEDVIDLEEEQLPSEHPDIVVCRPATPDRAALRRAIRALENLASEDDPEHLAEYLKIMAGGPMTLPKELAL